MGRRGVGVGGGRRTEGGEGEKNPGTGEKDDTDVGGGQRDIAGSKGETEGRWWGK